MSDATILSGRSRKSLVAVALLCFIVLAVGWFVAPQRVWSNLLVGSFIVLTIGLGGTVFVALTYVTGASWHVAFRRVPEAMTKLVPPAGVVVLAVLATRLQEYGWHHHGHGDSGSFWFKEFWLSPVFWYLRSIGYVVIWSLLGSWLVKLSQNRQHKHCVRLSVVFLAVYAVTFSLASVDWIMALEPMWFSTMWGVYNFAGMVLASLAAIVIFCVLASERGRPLHGIFLREHLHDLGQLTLGFSCFWMYIWFCQYMLIWYSNIPEETSYFVSRIRSPWGPIVLATIALNWVVPFFVLLPKPAKRSRTVMFKVAVVLLLGRWLDLYLMVLPATTGTALHDGVLELLTIAIGSIVALVLIDRSLRNAVSAVDGPNAVPSR